MVIGYWKNNLAKLFFVFHRQLITGHQQGGGDEDGGIGSESHADQKSQGKIFDGGATEKINRQQGHNHSHRSVDGTHQGFIKTAIDHFSKRLFA